MNVINLIPTYHVQARRRAARLRTWVTGCIAAYALVLLTVCGGLHMAMGSTNRAVADELARVVRDLEQTSKASVALQPELAEAQLQLEASRAVAVQPDWSVLMALLGKMRGDGVVLDRATLTPIQPMAEAKAPPLKTAAKAAEGKKPETSARKTLNFKVEVSGLGRTQNDVSQFVLRLEQAGLFNRVKLMETTLSKFNNEPAVAFRLECLMSEEASGKK